MCQADVGLGGATHETPFGRLVGAESLATMDAWYSGYGELQAFGGKAPMQGKMYNRGLAYRTETKAPKISH